MPPTFTTLDQTQTSKEKKRKVLIIFICCSCFHGSKGISLHGPISQNAIVVLTVVLLNQWDVFHQRTRRKNGMSVLLKDINALVVHRCSDFHATIIRKSC